MAATDRFLAGGWKEFRERLLALPSLPAERRQQFLFRGMSCHEWQLKTTLDRQVNFENADERDRVIGDLHRAFRAEALRRELATQNFPEDERPLELLARHHGLPSPMLDFTQSPYIAAFFAYSGAGPRQEEHVAIWVMDRLKVSDRDPFEIIDEVDEVRYNRRALAQRGVFVRMKTAAALEDVFDMWRYLLPAKERKLALADLEMMGITRSSLMCDFEAVAATVTERVLGKEARP